MTQKIRDRLDFLITLAYYAAIGLLVYLGLKYVLGWILPFILAFCIVSVVNPIIRFFNNKLKFKHAAASITVMVLTYGLIGVLLFELILQLVFVFRDLFSMLPSYYDDSIAPALKRTGDNIMAFIHQLPPPFADRLNDFNIDLGSTIQAFLGSVSSMGINLVSNITGHVPSFFIAFVFTIMLSFFISVQYDKVTLFIKDQLPQKAKKIISDLKRIVNDIILRYIKAMVKLMFITFVELAIGLLLIQRSATAIPIAAGIAIFDALPFFGTGAIMIPWVIVELIQGNFTAALGLGILYAIVTVIRNIIEPHIVGKKLGLNPIVSIVSIYLGFKIMGVLGMIFMPIIVQIIIELHNMGAIKIFRERKQNKAEVEAEQKASEADYTAEEP